MRYILYLLTIFVLSSCNHADKKIEKLQIDEKAKELNNRGIELAITFDKDSIEKAIQLFDQATKIQPDYYLAHWNKFVYQNQLGKINEALETLTELEKLKPENPDLKVTAGILTELNGDSISAKIKFNEADRMYKNILDTLRIENDPNQSILMNRAINMKLLGRENEGNKILKEIDSEINNKSLNELIESYIIMTRNDVLENFEKTK